MDLRNNSRHDVVKSSGLNDTTALVLMHSLFAPFSYSLLANTMWRTLQTKQRAGMNPLVSPLIVWR